MGLTTHAIRCSLCCLFHWKRATLVTNYFYLRNWKLPICELNSNIEISIEMCGIFIRTAVPEIVQTRIFYIQSFSESNELVNLWLILTAISWHWKYTKKGGYRCCGIYNTRVLSPVFTLMWTSVGAKYQTDDRDSYRVIRMRSSCRKFQPLDSLNIRTNKKIWALSSHEYQFHFQLFNGTRFRSA